MSAPLDHQAISDMVAVHLDSITRMGRPLEDEIREYRDGLAECIAEDDDFRATYYRIILETLEQKTH